MRLVYWDLGSDNIQQFLDCAPNSVSVRGDSDLKSIKEIFLDFDSILLNLDEKKRECEKFVKSLKKERPLIKIIYIVSNLTPKEMAKHQNSKAGGDIYLKPPFTEVLLEKIFNQFFAAELEAGDKYKQDKILDQHVQSEAADDDKILLLNTKLQAAFDRINANNEIGSEIDEHSLEESQDDSGVLEAADMSEDDNNELELELSDDDILSDDLEIDDELSLNLDGGTNTSELSLSGSDSTSEGLELSLDGGTNTSELSLSGGDDSISEGLELDLGSDDGGLELGSDDGGLELGSDDGGLELGSDDGGLELGSDDSGIDLSEESSGSELNLDIDADESEEIEFGISEESESETPSIEIPSLPTLDGIEDDELDISFAAVESAEEEDPAEESPAFDLSESPVVIESGSDMSEDALVKLAEIDAMMAEDEETVNSDLNDSLELGEGGISKDSDINLSDSLDSDPLESDIISDDLLFGDSDDSLEINESLDIDDDSLDFSNDDSILDNQFENQKEIMGHHNDELSRLAETIKLLREDREQLKEQIIDLEEYQNKDNKDSLATSAQIDELKIELTLSRRRYEKQLEELKYQLSLSQEKKIIIEEKNRRMEVEVNKLNQKVRVDINKIRNREQELESQLELLKADTSTQIQNRDLKILELKRRIDMLEFDMENMSIKEQKSTNNKHEIEDKMEKVISTLRNAIGMIEDDEVVSRLTPGKKNNIDM